MHRVGAVMLLLLSCMISEAVESQHTYFRHLSISDGLTENNVRCIIQDRNGFMWFGTKDGLNRYDGVNVKHFRNGKEGGFDFSYITNLCEDRDGVIWIGSDSGVGYYDPETECVTVLNALTKDKIAIKGAVTDIVEDEKGTIWLLAGMQGIFGYNKHTKELRYYNIPLNEENRRVSFNSIVFEKSGKVWLSSFGGGLWYSDNDLKTFHKFADEQGNDPFGHNVITKMKMSRGTLYLGVEKLGLVAVNPASKKVLRMFGEEAGLHIPLVRDFMLVNDVEMWICGEAGVYVYNMNTHTYSHLRHNIFDKYSLSDNAIYSIAKDREGGIWLGSYFGGVDYLPSYTERFEKYYENGQPGCITGQRVREICEDRQGRLWIGTEDNGLNRFNPATGRAEHIAASESFSNVHGLCEVGDEMWVGTFAQGLKVLESGSGRLLREYKPGDHSGINSNFIFKVYRTWSGELYIGTMSGLQRYDRHTDSFKAIEELQGVFIYDIMEDTSGNLWVATYSCGLYVADGKRTKWRKYNHQAGDGLSLPSNHVYSVYEDSHHTVWVLTQNGVCSYDSRSDAFSRELHSERFPQQVTYRMLEDTRGTYWVTTNNGLYSLSPDGQVVNCYTESDGLLSNQFNYSSGYRDKRGNLYFGCVEGFVRFNPMDFKMETKLPSPTIVDLWIFNNRVEPGSEGSPLERSMTFTDRIDLDHDQNTVSVNVVSLSYTSPAKHRIKYRLKGMESGWSYQPSGYSRITYQNLPSGDYTLELVAFNDNDEGDDSITRLRIVVHPPFYLTIWAKVLYLLVAIAAIYYAMGIFRRRNQRKTQEHIDRFTREKEREVYDAKFEFFTNVAHEIRTPLSLIKAPLESVMKSLKDVNGTVKENLDIMNLNVDRLLFLVNQLLDFRRIESKKFQISKERCNITHILESVYCRFQPTIESRSMRLTVDVPATDYYAVVDKEAVTKIISNLFTNATKYGESYIHVVLRENEADRTFSVVVSNDGDVIPPDKRAEVFVAFSRLDKKARAGAGIGLPYALGLAQLHNGTLRIVESDTENIFELRLPADAKPDTEDKALATGSTIDQILQKGDPGTCVLVVEDNEEMLTFVERQLIASHYKVVRATNGVEALKVLEQNIVNVIVSDVMMPEMDGFELCRRVKTDISYSHLPVILLTAKTNEKDKIEGLETGADAYIEKPFTIDYLLAVMESLLRSRKKLHELFSKQAILPTEGQQNGLSKVDEDFLRRLNEIIMENYHDSEFNMDSVIGIMNMSRSSFYRKIKGILDLSPNDYIRIVRLRKAAELLKAGNESITEICYMVGFSSPSYFSKCFQKQYGVLPKEYAAQQGH